MHENLLYKRCYNNINIISNRHVLQITRSTWLVYPYDFLGVYVYYEHDLINNVSLFHKCSNHNVQQLVNVTTITWFIPAQTVVIHHKNHC